MKRSGRLLAITVLTVLTLVCGASISLATIGTSAADASNNQQTRFNATAHCRDGTWRWAKNPDAPEVCAHHGGVAS
jgi:hypothetical protein